eukprot:c34306_g1_i1 orf=393-650(-)
MIPAALTHMENFHKIVASDVVPTKRTYRGGTSNQRERSFRIPISQSKHVLTWETLSKGCPNGSSILVHAALLGDTHSQSNEGNVL